MNIKFPSKLESLVVPRDSDLPAIPFHETNQLSGPYINPSTRFSTTHDLVIELADWVVDRSTLHRCTLVSKIFQDVFLPLLWKHATVLDLFNVIGWAFIDRQDRNKIRIQVDDARKHRWWKYMPLLVNLSDRYRSTRLRFDVSDQFISAIGDQGSYFQIRLVSFVVRVSRIRAMDCFDRLRQIAKFIPCTFYSKKAQFITCLGSYQHFRNSTLSTLESNIAERVASPMERPSRHYLRALLQAFNALDLLPLTLRTDGSVQSCCNCSASTPLLRDLKLQSRLEHPLDKTLLAASRKMEQKDWLGLYRPLRKLELYRFDYLGKTNHLVGVFGHHLTDLTLAIVSPFYGGQNDSLMNINSSLLQHVSHNLNLRRFQVSYASMAWENPNRRESLRPHPIEFQTLEHLSRLTSLESLAILYIRILDVSGQQLATLSSSWPLMTSMSIRLASDDHWPSYLESEISVACLVGLLQNMPHLKTLEIPCTDITPPTNFASLMPGRRSDYEVYA